MTFSLPLCSPRDPKDVSQAPSVKEVQLVGDAGCSHPRLEGEVTVGMTTDK